jgi:hypothetical protein
MEHNRSNYTQLPLAERKTEMNDYTAEQLLKLYNFPAEGIVEYDGKWYVPERIGKSKDGEPIWDDADKTGIVIADDNKFIWLILREQPLPPKPTPEQLIAITPPGKVARLLPVPSKTGVPYVLPGLSRVVCDNPANNNRTSWEGEGIWKGYRWLVELTDKVEAPVKRWFQGVHAIAAFVGEVQVECITSSGTSRECHGTLADWRMGNPITESEYLRLKAEWTAPKPTKDERIKAIKDRILELVAEWKKMKEDL